MSFAVSLVSGLGVRGGRVLLRDLGLELAAGQLLMLRGHNGAGKSSLLRCLAGLLPWRAGSLQWCGGTLTPGMLPTSGNWPIWGIRPE